MNILFFLHPKNDITYLDSDFTIRQALEKMYAHRFSVVPVVSKQGQFVGTISEGDILWYLKDKENLSLKDTDDILISDLPHYRSYESINIMKTMDELIPLVENQNFVPVVDDRDVFIGIITRRDVIKHLVERKLGE